MHRADSRWGGMTGNWARLGPPLRPTTEVVDDMFSLIHLDGPMLLLGVTPEFHGQWDDMTAVDRDQAMIDAVWPGNRDGQRAMCMDWMDMTWPGDHFAGISCDGGLGLLGSMDDMRELQQRCLGWLKPYGTVVHRVFCRTPALGASNWEQVLAVLRGDRSMGFHAFKMLCNFVFAEQQGSSMVRFGDIPDWFDDVFPDRELMSKATGWSRDTIDTIDLYRGSSMATMFCTRDEWLSTVPRGAHDMHLVTPDLGYDLWEQCPILSWSR